MGTLKTVLERLGGYGFKLSFSCYKAGCWTRKTGCPKLTLDIQLEFVQPKVFCSTIVSLSFYFIFFIYVSSIYLDFLVYQMHVTVIMLIHVQIKILLMAVKDYNPNCGDSAYTMGIVDLLLECVRLSYRPGK